MPRVRKLAEQEAYEVETTSEVDAQFERPDRAPSAPLDDAYPQLASWVFERGWIEIGSDENTRSFIRVLDIGGMVWEGKTHYPSIDMALRAAEYRPSTIESSRRTLDRKHARIGMLLA